MNTIQSEQSQVQKTDAEKMRQLQTDAIKALIGGVHKAQEKGVFTLEEAASLYQATLVFTGQVQPQKAPAQAPSAQ